MARAQRFKDTEVAKLLERAVTELAENKSVFVKLDRARRKVHKLNPTPKQAQLLRYIERHGFITFEESIGMHWIFLGGLFARGMLQWAVNKQGRYGIEVVSDRPLDFK